jgi:hypothetical protein
MIWTIIVGKENSNPVRIKMKEKRVKIKEKEEKHSFEVSLKKIEGSKTKKEELFQFLLKYKKKIDF